MSIDKNDLDDMPDAQALRHIALWAPRLPKEVRRRILDIADALEEFAAEKAEEQV